MASVLTSIHDLCFRKQKTERRRYHFFFYPKMVIFTAVKLAYIIGMLAYVMLGFTDIEEPIRDGLNFC